MVGISFENKKLNIGKLLPYGFEKVNGEYIFDTHLADGQMKLTVKVEPDGTLYTKMTDSNTGDEYVLHQVTGATGSFVGQVKTEYEAILSDISAKCFDREVFKSEQAKAVIAHVRETYGDELEYLWPKFPSNAIVRRKDNQKWYAVILTVSGRKLGFDHDEPIEILDLRIKPDEVESTVDRVRYFPGYHMNKKHWITILLDHSVAPDEIGQRIYDSYQLAKK